MNGFETPTIEYFTLSPILIVLGVAVLGVLVEAFLPRGRRYVVQVVLALAGLVAAFVTALIVFDRLNPGAGTPKRGKVAAMGALAVDGPALFCWMLVLVLALLSVLLFAERHARGWGHRPSPGRRQHFPAPRPSARPPPRGSSTPRSSRS